MTACRNPECTRLREDLATALVRTETECADRKARVTLGGPPPPVDKAWANQSIPGALHEDYAHLAQPHEGRARTSGTTEGEAGVA